MNNLKLLLIIYIMNKRLLKLMIAGFIFVSITGTIQHFLYDWLGQSRIVGYFCPVNESPWEHMKLLFFPYLIFTFYLQSQLKNDKFNIYFASYISIIMGMWSTLSYFYTFNGALGGNSEWVNISSFFVGVAVAFVLNYLLLNNSVGKGTPNTIAFIMLILTSLVFFLFTAKPPIIPLFQDPQSLTFGFGRS